MTEEVHARRAALVLIATPIGNLEDLSPRARTALGEVDLLCCEDTRHTGLLLQRVGIHAERLLSLHEHNEARRIADVLEALATGQRVGLVCDAGTPLISDPGSRLVEAVLSAGFALEAIPGPSAVIDAVVLGGIGSERFCFEGFLPRRGRERKERLIAVARREIPSVVYESPARVRATLAELAELAGEQRRVALCRELTKKFEEVWRGTLGASLEELDAHSPRGEYVLVIEGAPNDHAVALDLDTDLDALAAAGLADRDAVAALVALGRAAHRAAYTRVLERRAAPPKRPSSGSEPA